MKKRILSLFLSVLMLICTIPSNALAASKPQQPAIRSVVAKSTSSIKIKWKKVKGANGYVIYQKESGSSYKKIKTISDGSATSYTKKKLSSETLYTYKIKAYTKSGSKTIYSKYSNTKSCYTLKKKFKAAFTSILTTKKSASFAWSKVKGAKGYLIYQKTENGSYELIKDITSGKTTEYTKKGLSSNTKYTYKITAYKKKNGKKIFGQTSQAKTIKTSATIKDEDLRKSIHWICVSDSSIYHKNDKYQFVYDVAYFETLDSVYPIENIEIIEATVNKGKKCKVLQPKSKKKIKHIAKGINAGFPTYEECLEAFGFKSHKAAVRIISPVLSNKTYNDFKTLFVITFKNGAFVTIRYTDIQSSGVGGPNLWGYKDSDFK